MNQAAAKVIDSPLPMFTRGVAEADPAVDAVLKGEHMELNIPLMAGDTLVIPH